MQPHKIKGELIDVPLIGHYGGPWGTVPELLFEKKALIPALQELLAYYPRPQ
jgi:hypothetical protein